jgi:hypothetical protein
MQSNLLSLITKQGNIMQGFNNQGVPDYMNQTPNARMQQVPETDDLPMLTPVQGFNDNANSNHQGDLGGAVMSTQTISEPSETSKLDTKA